MGAWKIFVNQFYEGYDDIFGHILIMHRVEPDNFSFPADHFFVGKCC